MSNEYIVESELCKTFMTKAGFPAIIVRREYVRKEYAPSPFTNIYFCGYIGLPVHIYNHRGDIHIRFNTTFSYASDGFPFVSTLEDVQESMKINYKSVAYWIGFDTLSRYFIGKPDSIDLKIKHMVDECESAAEQCQLMALCL